SIRLPRPRREFDPPRKSGTNFRLIGIGAFLFVFFGLFITVGVVILVKQRNRVAGPPDPNDVNAFYQRDRIDLRDAFERAPAADVKDVERELKPLFDKYNQALKGKNVAAMNACWNLDRLTDIIYRYGDL